MLFWIGRCHGGRRQISAEVRDADGAGGVVAIELTSREKALVALLARGYTDEAAAAELGLSRRTIAYVLRALMDRLGVQNRFQLALVLGAAETRPDLSDDE